MNLLPRTLYGRLVLILVTGMLAAQVLTSSIWYDVRHSQVLEIPTRLIASRLADIVRISASDPQGAAQLIQGLNTADFLLSIEQDPAGERPPLNRQDAATDAASIAGISRIA